MLTTKQFTPYNELFIYNKVYHSNDLENLASRTHQIIPRTLLFQALATDNREQMLLLEGNRDAKKY